MLKSQEHLDFRVLILLKGKEHMVFEERGTALRFRGSMFSARVLSRLALTSTFCRGNWNTIELNFEQCAILFQI